MPVTTSMKKMILFSLTLFFLACKPEASPTNTVKTEDTVSKPSQRKYTDCNHSLAEAKRMDSILLGQLEVDPPSANRAIKAFTDYAYYCQNDSLSPVFLIKAAQVARTISNFNQAKIVLDFCIENYPHFRDRPAALFLLAQLYDEDTPLNNETEARRIYEQIIKEYPKSDWAVSAKGAIRFLGKSDEEMMREISKQK